MATHTQKLQDGLYELTESTRAELVDSKYYNKDLAPTSMAERTWNTYHISMLWVGMSICIPSFTMASGLVGMGLPVWAAVFNVILGNVLILIPIQLNSHAGTRYGIPFPGFARMAFGIRGAHLPSLSRAIVACGWCAVQSALGGAAVLYIVQATGWQPGPNDIVAGNAGSSPVGWIAFLVFLAMTWALTSFGSKVIRLFESIGSPILIIMSVALFVWAVTLAGNAGYGIGDVFGHNISAAAGEDFNFTMVFLGGLTGNIGFWATMALNIPDFSRFAKNQKAQFRGQLYGMPLTMAACAIVGAVFAQATSLANLDGQNTPLFSPVETLSFIDSKALLVILGIGVIIATLTTNIAANVVAPGNGFSNVAPRKISFFWGVTIACLIAIGYNFLLVGASAGNLFNFLNVYGGILAPLAAIFIVDYWLIKKQRLDVKALYQGSEGRYWYQNGFNVTALIAWIAGAILPTLYSIIQIATTNPDTGASENAFVTNPVLGFINTNSYIWAFIVAFVVYWLIGPSQKQAILTEEEESALTEVVA
ncbi:MAG: cytosine permease [Clostridiales Family XIII bacterium]|nr:cytosine permease [Clostridiales Family XIII bacterium]